MRVTIFDIEATDLGANFGRLLCCGFADLAEDAPVEMYRRDLRPWKGQRLTDDARLAVAIRDRLEVADIVVGWNSILYDVPFINTRLTAAGERRVRLGEKYGSWHLDLMYYAGGQAMRLPGRKLDTVARFLGTEDSKTPLTPAVWADAAVGEKEAMQEVVEHCTTDVLVLKQVFPKLAPFVKKITFNLSEVWTTIESIPSRRK